MAAVEWAPAEAIALGEVALQPEVWIAPIPRIWLAWMLGVIEHIHVRGYRLCRNDERVLRHVSRPVHLTLVVDLLDDGNFPGDGPVPTRLLRLFVIVPLVNFRVTQWQLRFRDHQVIWLILRCVRPENELLHRVVLAGRLRPLLYVCTTSTHSYQRENQYREGAARARV